MDFLKIIQENRVDDFNSNFSRKFSPGVLKKIIDTIPQKYLDWAGKNISEINFDSNLSKLSVALNTFDKISSNLPITDINVSVIPGFTFQLIIGLLSVVGCSTKSTANLPLGLKFVMFM